MTNISPVKYANFGQRLAAILIDFIPLGLLQWILAYLIGQSMADDYANGYITLDEVKQKATMWVTIVSIPLTWLYFALFESSDKQATLGKMVVGLRVTDLGGDRVGFGQATGRHFAKIVSGALLIGYLMPLWTQKKQALHDILSGCLIDQGGAKAVKSECDITPDLERSQGGDLDSKAQTSSGPVPQLKRIDQSKTVLSAADLVRLEQITSLRDRGTLSQSQFEVERDNILGAAEPISQAVVAPPAISPTPPAPPSSPPPETLSTAVASAQKISGSNVGFMAVMLLPFLLIGLVAIVGGTESSPAEEAAETTKDTSLNQATDNDEANKCHEAIDAENWQASWYSCPAEADKGDAVAQAHLGYMLDWGKGVMEDDAEAVSWYRKAANQGNATAQYNLGLMYEAGSGVEVDVAAAISWYRKAADQGDADAQNRLAQLGY